MPVLLLIIVQHAEEKAIVGNAVRGCTLFVTKYPCNDCSQLIIDHGIRKVMYSKDGKNTNYNHQLLIENLGAHNIEQIRLIFLCCVGHL